MGASNSLSDLARIYTMRGARRALSPTDFHQIQFLCREWNEKHRTSLSGSYRAGATRRVEWEHERVILAKIRVGGSRRLGVFSLDENVRWKIRLSCQ